MWLRAKALGMLSSTTDRTSVHPTVPKGLFDPPQAWLLWRNWAGLQSLVTSSSRPPCPPGDCLPPHKAVLFRFKQPKQRRGHKSLPACCWMPSLRSRLQVAGWQVLPPPYLGPPSPPSCFHLASVSRWAMPVPGAQALGGRHPPKRRQTQNTWGRTQRPPAGRGPRKLREVVRGLSPPGRS